MESVIAVPTAGALCPAYAPSCVNTFVSAGSAVGDKCTAACQSLDDGTRWCPTGADHSGSSGSAWGWCPKTPGAGGGGAGGDELGDDNADLQLAGIAIAGLIVLYVGGFVYFNFKTNQVMGLPANHVVFWKNVAGLAKDGFAFSVAKAQGQEHVGTGSYEVIGPTQASAYGEAPQVARLEVAEEYPDEGYPEEEYPEEEILSPSGRKKKKKKTPGSTPRGKKKTPRAMVAADEDGEEPPAASPARKKKKKKVKQLADAEDDAKE